MADSLYNIRLLREFSNEYLNKCFYLTLEDMLYAPLVLKVMMNYLTHIFKATRESAAQRVLGVLFFLSAQHHGFHCRTLLVV